MGELIAAYVAHPLGRGEDRESNRARAARWVAWVGKQRMAPIADWVILSGEWPEDDEHRTLGLEIDKELVDCADVVLLVGGRISEGMTIEREHADFLGRRVYDLTFLGPEPPPVDDFELLAWLDSE